MCCESQLAEHVYKPDDLPSKLGQTDLMEFISRSVNAELQVSSCSSYDLHHPG